MAIVLWVIAVILVLVGIVGSVIPIVPGAPLVFCGFLIAAWADNFQSVGWITLTILGFLTLLSLGVDVLASILGAKRVGASNMAIAGAAIGALVGIFFGIAGLFVGPFLGAVIGEYATRGDWSEAGKVGVASWLGFVLGTAVKLGLIFTMLGIFIIAFIL